MLGGLRIFLRLLLQYVIGVFHFKRVYSVTAVDSVVRGGAGRKKGEEKKSIYDGEGRLCDDCQVRYTSKSSYCRHPCRRKNKNDAIICDICKATLSSREILARHKKTIHDKGKSSNLRPCWMEDCSDRFYHVSSLYKHLEEVHSWGAKTDEITFSSVEAFQAWKTEEDKSHYLRLYKRNVKKKAGDPVWWLLTCNFQSVKPRWEQKKDADGNKKKGVWKAGVTPALQCPARMFCRKKSNGEVVVKYLCTHNHDCDPSLQKHCHMNDSDLDLIKEKLRQGVSVKKIQEDCQGTFGERENRGESFTEAVTKMVSISRRQIRNIAYNMIRLLRLPDLPSVRAKMDKLNKEKYSPVLVWKPPGENATIGGNYFDKSADLVAIGLQSRQQLAMFHEGGHRVVCIDGTHGTNRYGYQLINVVVPTEFGKGYPVAQLIVNRVNRSEVMIPFFRMLKRKLEDLQIPFNPKFVMTDDDGITGPAFQEVFGNWVIHILCHWHVRRNWERNLKKVRDENRKKAFRWFLERLLTEPNFIQFELFLKRFLDTYSTTEPAFIAYFKTYYVPRKELWAMACRNQYHAGTDTNMFCESSFNKLKTYYMKRKPTRRIDDLVDILLKMEKDAYISQVTKKAFKESPVLRDLMSDTHAKGSEIRDDDFIHYSGLGWFVQSQSTPGMSYKIRKHTEECSCTDKCSLCGSLCSHMYECTCPYNYSICKHIHKFYMLESLGLIHSQVAPDEWTEETDIVVHQDKYTDNENPSEICPAAPLGATPNMEFPLAEGAEEDVWRSAQKLAKQDPGPRPKRQKMTSDCDNGSGRALCDQVDLDLDVEPSFFQNWENLQISGQEPTELPTTTEAKVTGKTFPVTPKEETTRRRRREVRASKNKRRLATSAPPATSSAEVEMGRAFEIEAAVEMVTAVDPATTTEVTTKLDPYLGFPIQNDRDPILRSTFSVGRSVFGIADLKSIPESVKPWESGPLQRISHNDGFKEGWLTHRVIDAYLEVELAGSSTFAVTSRWWQDFQVGKNFRLPSVADYDRILFPSNPTGEHWVLYVWDKRSWQFLNSHAGTRCTGIYQDVLRFLHRLLGLPLNSYHPITPIVPPRALQSDEDEKSCGVFVCFYAKQCVNLQPYNTRFDVNQFRREMYEELVAKMTVLPTM